MGEMSHAPDWTIAMDAALCNRFTRCAGCGKVLTTAFFDLWTRSDGLVLPVATCPACKAADPRGTALVAVLDARYGP